MPGQPHQSAVLVLPPALAGLVRVGAGRGAFVRGVLHQRRVRACGNARSSWRDPSARKRKSCGGDPVAANLVLTPKGAGPLLFDRKARRLPCKIGETAMLPPIRPPRTGRTQRPGAVAYLALWGDPLQRAFCWGGGRLPAASRPSPWSDPLGSPRVGAYPPGCCPAGGAQCRAPVIRPQCALPPTRRRRKAML